MNRPAFLLYLFPLILGAAILATYGTGFVPVLPGNNGPVGPSYGFPLPYKYSFCELLPCALGIDWLTFWLDVLFYLGFQYALVVFYAAHVGKLPRLPSLFRLLGTDKLALAFQMALLSSLLMAFVPVFIVPGLPSIACLVPSSCQVQEDHYLWVWNVMMSLWVFGGFISLFAAEMVGLVGGLARRFMACVLIGLAGVQVSGVELFLASGMIGLLKLAAAQVSIITATVSIGPLLLFASALLLATGRPVYAEGRDA